jgi:hypothetical protein
MTLSAQEFTRRFLLHALPDGFPVPAHSLLRLPRQSLPARNAGPMPLIAGHVPLPAKSPQPPRDYRDRHEELTGSSWRECPVCRRGRMFTVGTFAAHRSPAIQRYLMSNTVTSLTSRSQRVQGFQLLSRAMSHDLPEVMRSTRYRLGAPFQLLETRDLTCKTARQRCFAWLFGLVQDSANHSTPVEGERRAAV